MSAIAGQIVDEVPEIFRGDYPSTAQAMRFEGLIVNQSEHGPSTATNGRANFMQTEKLLLLGITHFL